MTIFFGLHCLGQRVLREAGLATARALQNSSSVESMSFGKVHFAQEPSKTENFAASTLKSRALTHTECEGGGPAPGRPRLSGAPRLPLMPGPSASSRPSVGTVCVLWAVSSDGFVRTQSPLLFSKGSVPTELWIK